MQAYFYVLALVFAYLSGHAVAARYYTHEWFYSFAVPTFTIAAIACYAIGSLMP